MFDKRVTMPMKPRSLSSFSEPEVNEVCLKQQVYPSTGSVTTYYDTPKLASVNCGYAHGYDIVDFYKKKREGLIIPMTPFNQITYGGESSGNYDMVLKSGSVRYHYWMQTSGTWRYSTGWRLTAEDFHAATPTESELRYFVQAAAAKIYSANHDTLTFLSELAKTREMFMKAGMRLVKLLQQPRYRNMKQFIDFKDFRKTAQSDWLEGRYGWRTLQYDLIDLYEVLSNLDEVRTRYSERAGLTRKYTNSSTSNPTIVPGTLTVTTVDEVRVSLRGSVVADIEIPKFQFDPIQTGWELVPFSFVIDWFVSIGKSLAAFQVLLRNSSYTAATGCSVEIDREFDVEFTTPSSYYYSGDCSQVGTCSGLRHLRTPCDIPLTPQIKVRLDAFKIIDLLALIYQLYLRR